MGAQDWNHPAGGDNDFGLELVAALSGVVTATGVYTDGGRYVNIEHDDPAAGYRFRLEYMHLSTILVRQGQVLGRGQPIGLCGNTGTASTTSHLHYVVSQWINGGWVSVIPEPCFADGQTVLQTIAYDRVVNADNRVLPSSLLVLPETLASARNSDAAGYGGRKFWDTTAASGQPTSSCTWDVFMPADGRWKLWMHNPSGITRDTAGVLTHNSTRRAVFEVGRTRLPGLAVYSVDQGGGEKGSLLPVAEFDCLSGDRLQILQHNATGEAGLEMTYDELVLTLEAPGGTGGGTALANPALTPSSSTSSVQPTAQPATANTAGSPSGGGWVSAPSSTPASTSAQRRKGGGCTLGLARDANGWGLVLSLTSLVLLAGVRRQYAR